MPTPSVSTSPQLQPLLDYTRFIRQYLVSLPQRLPRSSWARWITPTIALTWLLLSLYPTKVSPPTAINQTLYRPHQSTVYSQLANYLTNLGRPTLAIRELQLASRLNPSAAPRYRRQITQLQQLSAAPRSLARQLPHIASWPDARDKYLALALKFHQLGLNSLARYYLNLAAQADPNYPATIRLNRLINP